MSVCSISPINVTSAAYDLTDYEIEGSFRLYCTDVSLLLAMHDFSLKQAIVKGTLSGNTKGDLALLSIKELGIKPALKHAFIPEVLDGGL